MLSGLTNIQQQIIDSDIKHVWWLVEIDIGSTGLVDYYLSTQAKTYDGHDYTANIKALSPIQLPFADMPLSVIPKVNASMQIFGIDGIEMTPDSTAVADGIGRTEADATTGWDVFNAPDTFESTGAGSPNEGSHHIHVVEATNDATGCQVQNIPLVAGDTFTLTFDCKIADGDLVVVLKEGDGNTTLAEGEYNDVSYTTKTITGTVSISGSLGKIIFATKQGASGEFYVDNISLKRKNKPYPSNFEDAAITVRLVMRAKDIDVTPDNTAVSDDQTEADATTGWDNFNAPDTFESTGAGIPNVGSLHFHVVEATNDATGCQVQNIALIADEPVTLTLDCKIADGDLVVVLKEGDGGTTLEEGEYDDVAYASKTITGTVSIGGSSGKLILATKQGASGEFYSDNIKLLTTQEKQIASWRFIVKDASTVDQVLTLKCQDWFTPYLEGDYPNTPLISDLFPADIMKDDNICVPIAFGTPFFPIRWTIDSLTATFSDSDTFTVVGDKTSQFQAGRFFLADCGVDGIKSCWVSGSAFGAPNTTVDLTDTVLTVNLVTVQTDAYVLGESTPTYTISKARTPREVGFKLTYDSGDYTFRQETVTGSDSSTYKRAELLGDDADEDGTNDANSFWGPIGKEIYDVPFRFSRDDLVALTDPTEIAEYILEDLGIPSAEIDDTLKATAAAIFAGRGFTLDVGLWYQMPRVKLLAKLFTIAGMIPIYRDKIGFKVLTKVSQKTITEAMIKPGSFSISRLFTQEKKDSGYVTWQTATEPVDQVNKSVISAKSGTSNRSDTTIEGEWCLDSVKAQTAGKLALQRVLLKDKKISFTANSKTLAVEPGDMITITADNYGAEGSSYDCLITRMTIQEGLWVNVECTRFSDDLDDWGDLAPAGITVVVADTDRAYSQVYQGSHVDADNLAGGRTNDVTGVVIIANDGHFKTNIDPATNGGADISNTTIRCYTSGGDLRFEVDYTAGATSGDVTIGDYGGSAGVKWDQSEGTLNIKVDSTGGLIIYGGGDITLEGSDADPGKIIFQGSGSPSYDILMGCDVDGNRFSIQPDTDDVVDFIIGEDGWFGDTVDARFKDVLIKASNIVGIYAGLGATENESRVYFSVNETERRAVLQVYDDVAEDDNAYYFYYNLIKSRDDNFADLGTSSETWKEFHIQKIITYDTSAPIVIAANGSSNAPTHTATKGTLYVTDDGVLYINLDGAEAWEQINGKQYGEFFWDTNAVPTVVETANIPVMLRNTTTGLVSGVTYHAGTTGAITAFSDGTGKVNVADAAHGLVTGDIISIRGTTNYNGIWEITKIDNDNFSIPDAWVANDGASDWDQGDYLLIALTGIYSVAFTVSISEAAPAGSDLHLHLYVNDNECPKCQSHLTTTNNKLVLLAGHMIGSLTAGDRIALIIESTGTRDITVAHGDLSAHQL